MHGPHRGGGGRRRRFDQGELRLLVLSLIAEQPRHGYDVIRAIEAQFGGEYSPSPGVIYPTLTLLEEMGLASVTEAEGRKTYALTEAGRAELSSEAAALAALRQRLAARRAGGPPAPLLRAMENLRLALRLRMAQGELSGALPETEVARLVALLDAAARAVESGETPA
ncbi:PadR family transcriptional regulator [Roseomonas sp. KE0001]|uniref:PadR family transcriptional regulator n=1 Tax=unclassified Roseomonas TaxID=2617492 RepID=UPI001E58EBF3|nr:PadR family transcriptional regulator [Roseomonas sp. KE0001]MBI0435400.1 PadR family transcriptional regulator [Roseomonas sp. KE0001]